MAASHINTRGESHKTENFSAMVMNDGLGGILCEKSSETVGIDLFGEVYRFNRVYGMYVWIIRDYFRN